MILKITVLALLAFVLYSLGSALVYMMRDKGHSVRMAKALTWRVGLSLVVFFIIIFSFGHS